DLRPARRVLLVRDPASLARAPLHQDAVTVPAHQFLHAGGRHPHPVLLILDLLGHTDDHGPSSPAFKDSRAPAAALRRRRGSEARWWIPACPRAPPRRWPPGRRRPPVPGPWPPGWRS